MDFSTQPTYKNPTQVDQNFPPVETWMSSRSLEPLQPSPWAALAPSPTLVWPAKKKNTSKLDINRRFMATPGHGAKIQDSNCFFWKKKHACLKIILVSTTNFPTFTAYWECFNVWNPPIIYRCIIYIIYVRKDEMLFVTHIMMIFLCDLNKKLHLLRQSLGKCEILRITWGRPPQFIEKTVKSAWSLISVDLKASILETYFGLTHQMDSQLGNWWGWHLKKLVTLSYS